MVALAMMMLSCQHEPAKEFVTQSLASNVVKPDQALELLKINCYGCHNPTVASHDVIVAPPLAGIKLNYFNAYPARETFIKQMSAFLVNPTAENAQMWGPVKRFGVMPKPPVSEADIKAIATYIYDHPLEEPEWFAEHEEQMHGSGNGAKQGLN